MFLIVGTKVLGRKSFLKEAAAAVAHVSSNTSTELESNFMLPVDRNPDDFKHTRRCPDFILFWFIADMNIWMLLVYPRWKFRLSWTNVALNVFYYQPMSVSILQV